MCSWLRNDACESKLFCPVILGIIHCYFVKVNYIKNSCLMMNLVKMSFNEMLSISRTDLWVYADYLIISLAFLFHFSCTTERELFHCIFVLYPVQMQVQSSKSTGEQWTASPHWPCACRSSLFLPGYLGVASPIGGRLPGIASDQGKQVRMWTSPNDLRSQRGHNSSLQVVPRPGSDELASRRNCFKWRW